MFWLHISDTSNRGCRIMFSRDWPSLWERRHCSAKPATKTSVLDNSLDNSASRSLSKALRFETGHRHPSFGDGAALPFVLASSDLNFFPKHRVAICFTKETVHKVHLTAPHFTALCKNIV
jgi:hypothetical protein